ncbi:MAG: hypothetical protein VXW87_01480 [Pseudomonadota bacterium]|nr:hypothetical protein [Pseudomonadota bacterium]
MILPFIAILDSVLYMRLIAGLVILSWKLLVHALFTFFIEIGVSMINQIVFKWVLGESYASQDFGVIHLIVMGLHFMFIECYLFPGLGSGKLSNMTFKLFVKGMLTVLPIVALGLGVLQKLFRFVFYACKRQGKGAFDLSVPGEGVQSMHPVPSSKLSHAQINRLKDKLTCPLRNDICEDPVTIKESGKTFSKYDLKNHIHTQWLNGHYAICPTTSTELSHHIPVNYKTETTSRQNTLLDAYIRQHTFENRIVRLATTMFEVGYTDSDILKVCFGEGKLGYTSSDIEYQMPDGEKRKDDMSTDLQSYLRYAIV